MKSVPLSLYLLVLAATLGGCMETESRGVVPGGQARDQVHFLRFREPVDGQMEAELEGELVLTEGCLQIQGGEREEKFAYTVIWPFEFSFSVQDNVINILDGKRQVAAQVGEQIQVSGGEFPLKSPEAFEQYVIGTSKCPEPYWLVGFEVRSNTP